MFIVYKATNSANGKSYIGKTTRSLEQRKKEHIAKSKKGSMLPFHSAIRKYGDDNFTWNTIAVCESIESLNMAEKSLISEYGTLCPNGYNIHPGGAGGDNISNHPNREFYRKLTRDRFLGKHLTQEHKEKISKTLRGHYTSEETRLKISQNHARPMYGRHHSEKTRELISKHNGRGMSDKKHSIEAIDKNRIAHLGKRYHSILTVEQVQDIKKSISSKKDNISWNCLYRDLAASYGVSDQTIRKIRDGVLWNSV